MQSNERLAVIEHAASDIKDDLAEIKGMLTFYAGEIERTKLEAVQTKTELKGELKIVKGLVGLALMASLGGGGTVLAKLFGILA